MHIIYADGIGSGNPNLHPSQSILYAVVERIKHHKPSFKVTRLKWPASMVGIGGDLSWTDATKLGVEGINAIIDSDPERSYILLGYSGGCRVVHEWMEQNPPRLDKIAAVGLMSDPFRPHKAQQNKMPDTRGWGICGQKTGPLPKHTFWVAYPGDVITDALPDALLRTPADVSDVMPGQFLWDLRTHLDKGDLQLAWQIGVIKRDPLAYFRSLGPRLHQARIDLRGYLREGVHTKAYTDPYDGGLSPAYRLADTIVWHINHS